ncbi:MAG: hypothetical protein ACLUMN_03900 [Oscillospiraceae bacterium]
MPQLFVLCLHLCGRKHAADLDKDGLVVIVRIDGRQQHIRASAAAAGATIFTAVSSRNTVAHK